MSLWRKKHGTQAVTSAATLRKTMDKRRKNVMLCELNWHGGQTHGEQAATWPGEGHRERVKNPRLVRKTYLGSDQHLNEKQKRQQRKLYN